MARSQPRGPLLPGAIKLRALLDSEGIAVPAFCEQNRLDRFKVQRALNGTARRVDVEFARAIELATMRKGKPVVAWQDWLVQVAPSAPSPAPSEPDSRRRRTPAPTRPAAAKVRRAS